ncbi:MAG: hypothetical protein KGJ62_03705 [Armatimonadetes bacterium]|nr:hypothetical protein [Armatimonadota bacterium]MDE2205958.1 hypothetical protein [Armatimonadota bacterium]
MTWRGCVRGFTVFAGVLGCAALLSPLSAAAQGDGDVSVGGEHLFTIRFPAAGMTVEQRASAIADRLVPILSDPNLRPDDIQAVSIDKNNAKIMVKDRLLVTLDERTAKFNTSTPLQLAQIWVRHLRKVLPEVNVKPNPNVKKAGG